MNYLIVLDGTIENIVVAETDVAEEMGFLPWYEGAQIGEAYNPPPPEPTLAERVAGLEDAIATGLNLYEGIWEMADLYKALASAIYFSQMLANGKEVTTDDQRLRASGLFADWTEGTYSVGDIRNAKGQTWECFQAHDTATYPDINPDNAAWFTFWRPLHGKSPDTARPFVPVQGAHDMYRAGEYMVYTDGLTYRCLSDTNYSPEEYGAAWEVYQPA